MNWLSKTFGKQRNPPEKSEMLKIIEEQFSQKDNLPEHNKWVVETIINRFSPQAIEEVRDELLQLEHQANKSMQPLHFLRTEIMKIVDSSCLFAGLGALQKGKH